MDNQNPPPEDPPITNNPTFSDLLKESENPNNDVSSTSSAHPWNPDQFFEGIGCATNNQNTSSDQVREKNQAVVPSTSRSKDPTRVTCLSDLVGGCLSGSSRRHTAGDIPTGNTVGGSAAGIPTGNTAAYIPTENTSGGSAAGIPTENTGGGPAADITTGNAGGGSAAGGGNSEAITTGLERLKETIEGFAGQKTRKEMAASMNMSVSSFDKLRKTLDLKICWPRLNKKVKFDKFTQSLSLPSWSNSFASTSNAATVSQLASTLANVLEPLMAALSNPTNTNLPSSSLNREDQEEAHKYKFMCLTPEQRAIEIQDPMHGNFIKVRANFKLPNGMWRVVKFPIERNTTFGQLSQILSKIVPAPQNMTGMFMCLYDSGNLINLIIEDG
ncbi:hypothetical protein ACJIZ3_008249 [Penstemon smallii]|uniref:Uncharacterized protein n=1 Tax=Penstemon smallii TaxID=265156 RepID=A0ABD3TA91_9LAMI